MLCVQLIEGINCVSGAEGWISTTKDRGGGKKRSTLRELYVLLSCVSARTASILSEISTLVAQTSEIDDYLRKWPDHFGGSPTSMAMWSFAGSMRRSFSSPSLSGVYLWWEVEELARESL